MPPNVHSRTRSEEPERGPSKNEERRTKNQEQETYTASIVIPCYNEEATLGACVEAVLGIADADLGLEVIIVDDHSVDRSREVASRLCRQHPEVRLLTHAHNRGKGAALRTGFAEAGGDAVAVQDADLEYEPRDLRQLIELVRVGKADVAFGSRFLTGGAHRVLYFWHSMGNRFLTFLSNMLTDLNLTDMETCYKVFRREVLAGIEIEEDRFGFEPEIVAKVAQQRPRIRIYEMGITYSGRTYEEGKKIGARDGFRALYCILRYNSFQVPAPLQWALFLVLALPAGLLAAALHALAPSTPWPSYAGFAAGALAAARQLVFAGPPATRPGPLLYAVAALAGAAVDQLALSLLGDPGTAGRCLALLAPAAVFFAVLRCQGRSESESERSSRSGRPRKMG